MHPRALRRSIGRRSLADNPKNQRFDFRGTTKEGSLHGSKLRWLQLIWKPGRTTTCTCHELRLVTLPAKTSTMPFVMNFACTCHYQCHNVPAKGISQDCVVLVHCENFHNAISNVAMTQGGAVPGGVGLGFAFGLDGGVPENPGRALESGRALGGGRFCIGFCFGAVDDEAAPVPSAPVRSMLTFPISIGSLSQNGGFPVAAGGRSS